MGKNKFFRRVYDTDYEVQKLRDSISYHLHNYWYNIWMAKYSITGFNESKPEDRKISKYVMKKLYSIGKIATFKLPHGIGLANADFATVTLNYMRQPATINLVNENEIQFVPTKVMKVNTDVTIGYAQWSQKPVEETVDYYIDRLIDVEMVMNTNLQLHKMPFIVGVTPEQKKKAEALLDRILNDEVAVICDVQDLDLIKSIVTNTPYIIDKLLAHKQAIESELKTYLGVDNTSIDPSKEFQLVDEINSNNGIINANEDKFRDCIQAWIDDTNDVFGTNLVLETKQVVAASVYDENGDNNDPSNDGKKQVTPGKDK